MKFNGYRALSFKAGKEVRIVSRNRTNFDNAYPQLIDALKSLTAKEPTIDREITAVDQNRKSSFQLPKSHKSNQQAPLACNAFDLLRFEGNVCVSAAD
jgi:bifunctional non-homologous end joining protein LigD